MNSSTDRAGRRRVLVLFAFALLLGGAASADGVDDLLSSAQARLTTIKAKLPGLRSTLADTETWAAKERARVEAEVSKRRKALTDAEAEVARLEGAVAALKGVK